MTKVNKLGWRNFVSGTLAVLVGLIPVMIYCLVAVPISDRTAGSIGFAIVIGMIFGTAIGAPLELFVVHRFKKLAALKTLAVYLVAGAIVTVLVILFFWLPLMFAPGYGSGFIFFAAIFMLIFVVYAITAIIARLTYPLIHRLLWRVSVPYGSPVAAEVEASTEDESTED